MENEKEEVRQNNMEQKRKGIRLQRQTFFLLGLITFIGVLLGVLVSGWYLIIPGLLGIGMMVAAIRGTCVMTMMLSKLPWNPPHDGDIS